MVIPAGADEPLARFVSNARLLAGVAARIGLVDGILQGAADDGAPKLPFTRMKTGGIQVQSPSTENVRKSMTL